MSNAMVMPFSNVLVLLTCATIDVPVVADCAKIETLVLIKPAIAPNETLIQ
jgi:hypothetical protein